MKKSNLIGDVVKLTTSPTNISYLKNRLWYLDLSLGMVGKIVSDNGIDKVGVEFEKLIWWKYKEKQSKFDNGCHNKGKLHHCVYLPYETVKLVDVGNKVLVYKTDKGKNDFIDKYKLCDLHITDKLTQTGVTIIRFNSLGGVLIIDEKSYREYETYLFNSISYDLVYEKDIKPKTLYIYDKSEEIEDIHKHIGYDKLTYIVTGNLNMYGREDILNTFLDNGGEFDYMICHKNHLIGKELNNLTKVVYWHKVKDNIKSNKSIYTYTNTYSTINLSKDIIHIDKDMLKDLSFEKFRMFIFFGDNDLLIHKSQLSSFNTSNFDIIDCDLYDKDNKDTIDDVKMTPDVKISNFYDEFRKSLRMPLSSFGDVLSPPVTTVSRDLIPTTPMEMPDMSSLILSYMDTITKTNKTKFREIKYIKKYVKRSI